ncbi:MAG: hypothetical protein DRH93_03315 [Deltaproteobacteria bacterium]|nr:MAG: hypothetical protein DRH93_03315 [Deltaproteobacteria bacterium]
MGNSNESVSQQLEGIVDTGAENFSVDLLIVPADADDKQAGDDNSPDGSQNDDQDQIIDDDQDDDQNDDIDDDQEKKSESSADSDKKLDGDKTDHDDDESENEDYSERVQKRIGKITAKRKAAEELSRSQQELITTLEERLEALEGKKDLDKKPDSDDFETAEEFEDAMVDWKVRKKIEEQRLEDQKHQQEVENAKIESKIQEHMATGEKKYKDFAETMEGLELKRSLLTPIAKLKNSSDVIYYLGKNQDKADDLNDLVQSDEIIEAGALLQRISSSIKSKKLSSPPKPIRPTKGKSNGTLKSLDEMSNAEYRKARAKQEKRRTW